MGLGNIDTLTAKSACVEEGHGTKVKTSLAPLWRTENPLPRFNVQSASVSITTGLRRRRDGEERDCSVKRLIRNKQSKKFLTADGSWTTDFSAAEDFGNIELAIKAEQKLNLNGVELLMVMEDKPSRYDIVLPLGNGNGIHKRR